MPARITGAARFIKNTNPKPILEGEGALVYNLELHDLGVAGLPECVRLEHVGGVGDLDPITGLVVLIIQLNVKVAGRNDVVCARYGIRKPGKRSAEKHGKAEHERKNAQYQCPLGRMLMRHFYDFLKKLFAVADATSSMYDRPCPCVFQYYFGKQQGGELPHSDRKQEKRTARVRFSDWCCVS